MMKKLFLIAVLLIYSSAYAQDIDYDLPVIWGGLDWSADGQYLAVATTQGVYIHSSDDLSVVKILDESLIVHTVNWSYEGYQLVYDDREGSAIIIYDLETNKHRSLNVVDTNSLKTVSIRWSPDDQLLAFGEYFDSQNDRLFLLDVVEEVIISEVNVRDYTGHTLDVLIDWSPNGEYLFVANGADYVLIWNTNQQQPAYIWEFQALPETEYPSRIDTMKWDRTGTRLAGGWSEIMYILDAETGQRLDTLRMDGLIEFQGLSWHPEQDKLAFIGHRWRQDGHGHIQDDSVIIWDLLGDEVTELFGIVYTPDNNYTQNAIQWSPDGSKLASISSDGRVIIWETENYEVIAEYDGYRSIVPEGTE